MESFLSSGFADLALVAVFGVLLVATGHKRRHTPAGRALLILASILFTVSAVYEFTQSEIVNHTMKREVHPLITSQNGPNKLVIQPQWNTAFPFASVQLERKNGSTVWPKSDKLKACDMKLNGKILFTNLATWNDAPSLMLAQNVSIQTPITVEYEVTDDTKLLLSSCQVRVYHASKFFLGALRHKRWVHRLAGALAALWLVISLVCFVRAPKASPGTVEGASVSPNSLGPVT